MSWLNSIRSMYENISGDKKTIQRKSPNHEPARKHFALIDSYPIGCLLTFTSYSTYLTTAPPQTITATSISVSIQPASTIVTTQLITQPASTVTTVSLSVQPASTITTLSIQPASTVTTLSVQPASTVTTLSLSIQPASTVTTLSIQPASTVTTLSVQPASTITTLSIQPASTVTTLSLSIQPASTITVSRSSAFSDGLHSSFSSRGTLLSGYRHAQIFSKQNCLHREHFGNQSSWIWFVSRERAVILEKHSRCVPCTFHRRLGRFSSMQLVIQTCS